MSENAPQLSAAFAQEHDFLVAVDSDGCALDTMTFKHLECFTPQIIKFWGLEAVRSLAEQTEQFVNLYSKWRGLNRFPALLMVLDLLGDRPEVRAEQMAIPPMESLRAFLDSGQPQSNAGLQAAIDTKPDDELEKVLQWSHAVNRAVAEKAEKVRPFPSVRHTLETMAKRADLIVVSQMPHEACAREWREHGLAPSVAMLGGQELGSKAEQLRAAADGRYQADQVLMVGDAPGDLAAAQANDALFFPTTPGREECCWQQLGDEGFDRLLSRRFAGEYQDRLIKQFEDSLPDRPPWLGDAGRK